MCGAHARECKRMSNYETVMNQDVSVTQPVPHPGPAAHTQGPGTPQDGQNQGTPWAVQAKAGPEST